MSNTFKYFAFGSNLLKERLQLLNPSACYVDIGNLKDYKLSFDWKASVNPLDQRWCGCPATIKPQPGETVWGTVWTLNNDDLPNLDKQEGVPHGVYQPVEVTVQTPNGEQISCRTYQLLLCGTIDPRPSPHYLDVIVRGARQSGLPEDYVNKLTKAETNRYEGECELYNEVMAILKNKNKEKLVFRY